MPYLTVRSLIAKTTLRVLAFTMVLWLTFAGPAVAQQIACSDPLNSGWLSWPVNNPEPADRQAIVDLLSAFNWALDENDGDAFRQLFAEDAVYESCWEGGLLQTFKTQGRNNIGAHMESLRPGLISRGLRTRHFVSNTLLNAINKDEVQGKATLLVSLQSIYKQVPELDYTATIKAVFERGSDDVWRISALTLIMDTSGTRNVQLRGR